MHIIALFVLSPYKEKKRKMQKGDRREAGNEEYSGCLQKEKGLMKYGKLYKIL